MKLAKINAGIPIFLSVHNNIVAAVKEEKVCPEGKEYPEGAKINKESFGCT